KHFPAKSGPRIGRDHSQLANAEQSLSGRIVSIGDKGPKPVRRQVPSFYHSDDFFSGAMGGGN
ncbi:MAG: hypothetical protein ABWZ74_09075, partial [Hyphomicrobiaceae bacterium]